LRNKPLIAVTLSPTFPFYWSRNRGGGGGAKGQKGEGLISEVKERVFLNSLSRKQSEFLNRTAIPLSEVMKRRAEFHHQALVFEALHSLHLTKSPTPPPAMAPTPTPLEWLERRDRPMELNRKKAREQEDQKQHEEQKKREEDAAHAQTVELQRRMARKRWEAEEDAGGSRRGAPAEQVHY
jgi:hypothetical protein